jgi:cell division initiation protein
MMWTAFCRRGGSEMEGLLRENTELKEQANRQSRELGDHAQREKDLRETMLAAQRITDEMKANAQKEAELIVSEAQLQADGWWMRQNARWLICRAGFRMFAVSGCSLKWSFKALLDNHAG